MTLGRSSRSRSMSRSATGRPVTSVFRGASRKSDGASGPIVSSGLMSTEAAPIDFDRVQSVGDLLRARAAERPDQDFLWCDAERWTYADADRRTDVLAAGLGEAGVADG